MVLIAPLIKIVAAMDSEAVRTAIRDLDQYQWLVLTSVNGVTLFAQALAAEGKLPWAVSQLRVACVGPATAAAAASHGIPTDVIPEDFAGDALAEKLVSEMAADTRVLIARAGASREVLPRRLAERGAKVDEIELYRSLPDEAGAQLLREHVLADKIDVITFTSGSTVRYFAETVGQLAHARVAVIGPATAAVARQHNVRVDVEADRHTTRGLVEALAEYYRRAARPTED